MGYKDTLTLYEEQIAKGVPNEQAKIIAHQIGSLGDELSVSLNGIRDDIKDMRKDMFWMRVIGTAMTVSFLSAWFR